MIKMLIETEIGNFELIKNYKDAFNLKQFIDSYTSEVFDRYNYIVGDVSANILRLKGFSQNYKSDNSYKKIPDYINESCNYNCAFFVLRRIKEVKE